MWNRRYAEVLDTDPSIRAAAERACADDGVGFDTLRRYAERLDRALAHDDTLATGPLRSIPDALVELHSRDGKVRQRMVGHMPPFEADHGPTHPAFWTSLLTWGLEEDAIAAHAARRDQPWRLGHELVESYKRVAAQRKRERAAQAQRERRAAKKAGTWRPATYDEKEKAKRATARQSLAELIEWFEFARRAAESVGEGAPMEVWIYWTKMEPPLRAQAGLLPPRKPVDKSVDNFS